jgi:hypothetical protein
MTALTLDRPSLLAFASLAADLAWAPSEAAKRLSAAIAPPDEPWAWRSTLNNDGSPLQISVSLAGLGAPPQVRLIADPAAAGEAGDERIRLVEDALGRLLATHGPEMGPLCRSVLNWMLPADVAARAALPSGGAWLAADLGGQGLALYATAKWGDPDTRWVRARAWLRNISPRGSVLAAELSALPRRTTLLSAGVEGSNPSNARAKLYWRLDGSAPLSGLGVPLLGEPAFADFLRLAMADLRVPLSAIVGSVSVSLASGEIADAKLDLCCHCVRRPWREWTGILDDCSTRLGLADFPFADLNPAKADLAFVGFGLTAAMAPRLNVYLKPPEPFAR